MIFDLPEENEAGLTAKDIMEKIRHICDNDKGDGSLETFLLFLRRYPQSICTRTMSDKIKLLMALYREELLEISDPIKISYEELGALFDRSKSSVFQAVNEKGEEAKRILTESKLRMKAKDIALAELVQEEKDKLTLAKTVKP
jgi:hypothetical protein